MTGSASFSFFFILSSLSEDELYLLEKLSSSLGEKKYKFTAKVPVVRCL